MTTSNTSAARTPRGVLARWGWPVGVAAVLLTSAVSNVWVMFIAKADPAFAVEPDYYAKAVAWDEHMAQGRRNAALGWHASATLTLAAAPEDGRVTVHLRDAAGLPLDEARVTVEAMHNARASRRHQVALRPLGNGTYDGSIAADRAGAWELRLTAARDSARFTETIRLDARR